jgi:hypothetical protein
MTLGRASHFNYKCGDKQAPPYFKEEAVASHGLPYPPQILQEPRKMTLTTTMRLVGSQLLPNTSLQSFTLFWMIARHPPTAELAVMRAKGGLTFEQRALRKYTLNQLMQKYPTEWEGATKDSRKSSGTTAKYVSPHLATGNRNKLEGNMRELVPGMPLHLGCMVVNMPTTIVDPLIGYYGNPKVQQTVLGDASFSPALPIDYSPHDKKFRAIFVADLVATQAAEAAAVSAGADADSLFEDGPEAHYTGTAAEDLARAAEVLKQIVLEASLTIPDMVKATVAHDVEGTGLRSTMMTRWKLTRSWKKP